jgi:GxxExxY protein
MSEPGLGYSLNHDLSGFVRLGGNCSRMTEYKYREITEKIIGSAMKVHAASGNGFQEVIYQRALQIELNEQRVSFETEYSMPIFYKQHHIGKRRVDFLVEGKISVELKAVINLEPVHFEQARNYLEAYNLEIGLLLNFASTSLQFKRQQHPKFVLFPFPLNQQNPPKSTFR